MIHLDREEFDAVWEWDMPHLPTFPVGVLELAISIILMPLLYALWVIRLVNCIKVG